MDAVTTPAPTMPDDYDVEAIWRDPAEDAPAEVAPAERDFGALVARVANARREHAALKERADELRADFAREHAELLEAEKAARENVAAAEAILKEEALAELYESGDKAPWRGVKVQNAREYTYDDTKALAWAVVNAPDAVELKAPKLRQALNKLREKGRLPEWAELVETHKVTLAKDLGAGL